MKPGSVLTALTIYSFVVASASAVGWFVEIALAPLGHVQAMAVFAAAAVAALTAAIVASSRARSIQSAFGHFLDGLSRCGEQASGEFSEIGIPPRLQGTAWVTMAGHLREML
ncbi:MAG: hypothetical protein ACYC6Y_30410, partial [Thermoguttaceae bacterium]